MTQMEGPRHRRAAEELPIDDFYKMAAQIEGTKWLILDTSHKTALPESLRQDATMNLYWACNVGQEASEDDRSGVFTRAFVDVLWTAYGPLTNDGLLTAIQSRIGATASSKSRADLDVEDLPMDQPRHRTTPNSRYPSSTVIAPCRFSWQVDRSMTST